MKRFSRHSAVVAFLLAAGFAVTSCESGRFGYEELETSDIAGTWESNKGGLIVFTEDGAVSFSNITQDPYCVPEDLRNAVPRASGAGKWSFETVPDERPGVKIESPTGKERPAHCILYAIWTGKESQDRMYLRQDDGDGESYKRIPADRNDFEGPK
ncbi:hypothetical protein DEJ51_11540 [Streptomyces venezuelae]|uniref:Lipoprotein n=1 Tax=Streptomyces venezuelae TaxID=54571 RepID=A0A5P2DNL3_STRVZ|nr:hypothetical protein [Streptomyces venezuelae]QES54781.1 hypothetical protein DEJ51_11540 [Streptomyces venezuelae]